MQNHSGEMLNFLILVFPALLNGAVFFCPLCLAYADKKTSLNCVYTCLSVHPSKFAWSLMPIAASSPWRWIDWCFECQKTLLPFPAYFPNTWTPGLQLQNIHVPHVGVLPSAKSMFNQADVKTSTCGESEERQLICRQIVSSAWHRLPGYTAEGVARSWTHVREQQEQGCSPWSGSHGGPQGG